ncbi:putative EXPRESSED-RELATED [Salix purpurea]|uniref:EXPRESSED-RELATED n=1 Tax=Salix purpurea TaxID=77065 RepID=A0A9Q1A2Z9_SALPP|nr:putative EXPRESSED-RELATED [Salix purpurea]
MSAISGVISRQVMPACGSLCFFCPAMRARSRQPVKRYKKLIADIFPRNQEEGPNDRKIGKLCEYAAKNPLRIPRITCSLEQRCYKELRIENFQSAKIVMCIYRKLLVTCKEQMPLFASSLLSIINTLLDQTRQVDIQVIGCETLFGFINNQKDGTYMFNLEGFIPKLCQFAQEEGEDEREKSLRAAGLQALSSMVWFMGQHSHISEEFDNVVSAVLESCGGPKKGSENLDTDKQGPQSRWVQEVLKNEGHVTPSPEVITGVPSWRTVVNERGEVNMTEEDSQNPCFWSRVCLHNMAKLGKEATTTRRVLESLFRYFDNGNLWSLENGLAFKVLKDMQFLMDNSGIQAILLPTQLHAKVNPSVAIIGAVSDAMRHLRKSIHCSLDDANLGAEIKNWNKNFREVVDKCLTELVYKVGDAGPILDIMAVMLENISNITVIARTMISAVYRTAQIVASLPNLSYQNKVFPEALFHQLLPAMVHPDHETRVGAHRIFSVVLVPIFGFTLPIPQLIIALIFHELSQELSLSFLLQLPFLHKLWRDKTPTRENAYQDSKNNAHEGEQISNGMLARLKSSTSRVYSMKNSLVPSTSDENPVNNLNKETEAGSLRLTIAHTYSLVLLFSRTKNCSDKTLIRSFQLAFSLRNIALKQEEPLSPSRRRSLFALATSMILFTSKAYNMIPLIYCTKVVLTEKMIDPFLHLVEDRKLQAVSTESGHPAIVYGSKEDDSSALKSLSEIDVTGNQSREFFAAEIAKSLGNLENIEVSTIQEKLLSEFLPDDVCPLGAQLFMDTPKQTDQIDSKDNSPMEDTPFFTLDDVFLDSLEGQTTQTTEIVSQDLDLLSVNQLLELVLETTQQVGRLSVTAPDVSYKEMAHHCETLLMGKATEDVSCDERPVSNPFLEQNITASPQIPPVGTVQMQCGAEYQLHPNFFRLPASSPFDNFLKAAGC